MKSFLYLDKNLRVFFIALFSVGIVIAVTVALVLKKRSFDSNVKKLICCIIYIIISLILITESHIFVSKTEYLSDFNDEKVSVLGTVTDVRYNSSDYSSFEVIITSINESPAEINAILDIPAHSTLKSSDTFTATGNLSPLSFEEDDYLIAKGFNGRIVCESKDDLRIKSSTIGNTAPLFKRINSSFQNILTENTNEEVGAFAGALLLGNRESLSDEIVRDFRRSGISHMLALSGLHISIIIGFFDLIMRNMFINKKIRCVLLVFLSLAYLAITGFSPSASRAVIMLCIVYISHLINNESESLTSLFIALTIILIISPHAIYDIGLWMSFFATIGIIIISELLSKLKFHIKKKPILIRILITMTVSVLLTFTAIISICIFSWLCFGEISILSPITNIIFSPLMTFARSISLTA